MVSDSGKEDYKVVYVHAVHIKMLHDRELNLSQTCPFFEDQFSSLFAIRPV